MKRVSGSVLLGMLGALAVSSAANAQRPFIFFGGGLTFPVGDFGDEAKSGWMATGGISVDIGTRGLFVEAEGYYGTNDYDLAGLSSDLYGGLGTLGYAFGQARVHPYVLGGAGFFSKKTKFGTASATETEFAYTGAAGLTFTLSPTVSFWVEGRYIGAGDFTKFVPVMAGLVIQLGN